mmetsp:Transcript_32237/g.96241  ORF Transcript_32237/g.96241 Transcript_32237/m.96241 type:complete len:229 (+) Transcript_32237:814-1500(+)
MSLHTLAWACQCQGAASMPTDVMAVLCLGQTGSRCLQVQTVISWTMERALQSQTPASAHGTHQTTSTRSLSSNTSGGVWTTAAKQCPRRRSKHGLSWQRNSLMRLEACIQLATTQPWLGLTASCFSTRWLLMECQACPQACQDCHLVRLACHHQAHHQAHTVCQHQVREGSTHCRSCAIRTCRKRCHKLHNICHQHHSTTAPLLLRARHRLAATRRNTKRQCPMASRR